MNTISIPTSQNISLEYPIASVGDRIFATIIDSLLLGGYFWFIMIWEIEDETTIAFLVLPIVFYSLVMEIFYNGQSLGKRAVKIKVVRLDGAPPSSSEYLLRWVLRPIDLWSVMGLVAMISISQNKNGQRLGDILAGTTVVKLKLVTVFGDTMFVETEEDYEVAFPSIRLLADKDMAILKEVLDAGLSSKSPVLLAKLSSKVKEVLGIKTKLSDRKFLQTVLKDYNHLYGGK